MIKKYIKKNPLSLKKFVFIGLLSLIFNSNLYAQLVGPTSDWNTVIQSDVYGDAIFEPDANKQDLFGNSSYPVLQSAYNGSNFYFKVLLNGSTTDLNKDLKFFLGIDADQDNDIDFFIKFKRKKNGYGHELKFFNTDSGSQSGPSSTSWDGSKNNYFKSSNSDDLYSSNSDIGSDLSGSGNDDHFYIFGFPISLLQTFIASDFPAFNSSTTVNLIAFSAEGGDKDLDGADRKDILGIDDTTIQNGNGYNSSYSWSSLFVTNSFDGFSGNGDNTAPNLTQVTAITTPSNDTTPSYVFTTDEAGTISTSISQGFSTSSSGLTGSNQTIIFNTLPEGTYSGETITVTDTAGNAGSITIPDFVIDTTAPVITVTSGTDTVERLSSWTDAGATSDTGETVTASGTVDTTTVGDYTITYNVTDSSGNAATAVTRTVTVEDTTAPVITVTSGTDTVERLSSWTDAGATSDTGETVTASGTVDTTTVGDYTITYNVTDSSGNAATAVTRTVTVEDTTAPVITVTSGTDTVERLSSWTDAGATSDTGETVTASGTVDTTTVGDYTITYNVTDSSGNAATAVTRTVTVEDTTAPVITVTSGTDTVERLSSWTDAGATSDTGETVTASGTVDTTTVGDYTITYNVTDSSGNAATAVTRTVTVEDTTAPVITVTSGTDTVERLSSWTDAGATSDTGETVTASGTVDTTTVGDYTITYNVTDSSGNAATAVTRTVTVEDTTAPVITVTSGTDTVERLSSWTDAGATSDTGETVTASGTVDTTTVGDYTITYNVTDSSGNAATAVTRTVTVEDTTAPVITVTSGTDTVERLSSWTDAGATSDTGETVTASGTVDTTTVGDYTITYNVTDSSGNAATAVTRTVTVEDTTAPVITVTSGTDTVERLSSWTDAGATSDTGETVTASGTVDTTTVGDYTITYNVTDSSGNAATAVTRTVTVEDTTAPVITVTSGTDTVERLSSWTDAGATSDTGETVTASGTVDTTTVGDYTITYNVTDSSGNAATAVTRTVTVEDTTAPVITVTSGTDTVERLSSWTDAGATSDTGETVTASGTVDTTTVGDYTITYNVTDSSGNAATAVTRTVTVEDTTAPVITVTSGTDTVERLSSWTDAGATSDTGETVTASGTVDTTTVGDYTITYNVTDSSGNAATAVTRTVTVEDTTAPVITVTSGTDTVERLSSWTDAGATSDTGETVTASGTVDTTTVGDYTITYNVTDSSGNAATAVTRTVTVEDTTAPVITVTSGTDTVERLSSWTDAGATSDTGETVTASGTVDTTTVGDYTITYNVTDSSGNAATAVTRTVTVEDTTAPVITVTSGTDTVERLSSWTDAGATSDTGETVTASGTVDTTTVGDYTITYNVTDSSGNAATAVTRTVTVEDTTAPVITVTSGTDTVERLSSWTDAGATSDTGETVTASGTVDTTTVGDYTITYNVTDSSGNAATAVTRTVTVEDTTAPVITVTSGTDTVERLSSWTDAGATSDTGETVTASGTVDTTTVGDYTITYNVTDSSGNAATAVTRTVTVEDTTAPVITVTSGTDTVERLSSWTDAGATSDTGETVTASGTVDTTTVGDYTITYNVTDSSGNAATAVTRTVTVEDTTAPVITVTSGTDTVERLSSWTDAGATSDTGETVTASGTVDTTTVGDYTITYNVTDSSGNAATAVTRTVTVEDTTAPVITVTSGTDTVERLSSWTDAGATSDTGETVTASGTVDTTTVGDYTITYNVTDSSGNAATAVTRTVTVEDTTAPVITVTSGTDTVERLSSWTDAGATSDTGETVTASGTVDTTTVGDYTITYNVTDSSGNAATAVTRTVTVEDTTAPVITVTSGTDTVERLSSWTDAGATSDTGETVTASGTVDTTTVGDYTITYNVTDSSGNAATAVTRTVTVEDTTAPVITTSSIESSIEEGDTALGSVSANETVTWSVGGTDASYLSIATNGTLTLDTEADYETKTSYSFTVTATDALGNTTTISALVISVNDDGKVFICHVTGRGTNGKTVTLEVSPNAVQAHLNHGDSLGACDSDVDIISPEITSGTTGIDLDENSGSGQTIYTIIANDDVAVTSYAIAGTDASLLSVNSSTGVVTLIADPDYETKNSYSFTVTASDVVGNTSDPTTVTFSINDLDDTIPEITLVGANPQSIELGTAYSELGATATDNIDGDITGSIVIDASAVDVNTVGDYTVTYDVQDAAGNQATQVTRTVTITADVTIPEITLVGANPQSIELGTAYSELGATATDNIDGDITGSIVIDASAVDVNTVGDYTVTYDVQDAAGNQATQVTRTVTITADVTIPEITLVGANPQSIELGTAYSELGATATDNIDGDITGSIVIDASAVDVNTVGDYTVTYDVQDAAGNQATQVTRTVTITADVTIPEITLVGANPQSIELGTAYSELGATATDNIDGDITGSIVIDASAVDVNTVGDYTVTYDVQDAAGNQATQVTRTVTITADVTIPEITLVGANPQSIELGTAYSELGATATDNIDGDITGSIVIDASAVDVNTVGDYTVTYDVQDAAGNQATQVTRTVTITADVTIPEITLVGANPQSIELGTAYSELGATATDNIDGDITGSIVIDASAVDVNTVGDYTVTYDVQDAAGNQATQVTRTVTITADVTIPEITLVGANPQSIELGTAYSELGATATDNIDGDITGSIVIDASAVDVNTVGDYTVTYDVQDAAGNQATQVTRTVTITADVTIPEITLVGANPQSIELGTAYSELGATATDNIDGDITGSIVIDASAVDVNTVGDYTVTYDVQDAAGNQATQVTRTVTITADVTIPEITLVGANPQSIELGTAYSELGATATDNIDGDITGSIVIDASAVDVNTVGDYTVTYDVQDAAGNQATQVTRTVTITADVTIPEITLVGANPQSIELGTAYSELGATATDNIDGDITGSIVIDASAVDVNTVGDYTVTYDVQDAAGNQATQVTRTVTITADVTIPEITLVGANPQSIELGTAYSELGATATDNIDGDITGSIVIDASAVDVNTVGDYTVTYDVQDAAGNQATQVTRTVTITADVTIPEITLVGANPQSIELGTAYSELGATATDNIDGDITGSIVIDASAVDVNTVGDYTVTYDVQDAAGNQATQVTRTVTITADVTIPEITLVGANPQSIELGTAYSELGATATDNIDGDITGSIVIDASAVDVNTVGDYTVTYDVQDAAGNQATQVTRTVTITADVTIPEITLVGANPQSIELGTAYSELGATATDNIDGDITGSIVIDASAVDVNTVGDYTVTYDVQDAAGNQATQVTRTVTITADVTIPEITLVGANPQSIELGTAYSELGATATDNIDGDITGSIVIDASAVDVNTVGDYTVTYDVQDAAGNQATQVTRTVTITADVTIPEITLVGANPQSIELGTAYSELGATATDNIDGDITGSIVIDASAVDVNTVGDYTVTYDVQDAAGNQATQVTRTVTITADVTIPEITLVGANPQSIELGTAYSELGATATDNIDGDITGSIVIDASAVDVNTVGDYTVTYDVQDAAGNQATQVTRTVTITADVTIPEITLVGANPQSIELGTAYSELGATATDNIDGDITGSIVIDASAVDVNTVGDYTVTYDVQDAAGNQATQVTRTVTITADVTIPEITLVGANPQSIELGTAYSELGATATDNIDGDITGSIVIDASAVDVNTVGDYTVTYDVQDAAGNQATQVTRTVTITADVTIPEITLVGANPQSIELGTAYSELGATATDNIDGDITGSIVIDASAVDVNTVGDYTVTYDVQDAAGNQATQVTRTVTITADVTIPEITLVGANPQSIELGTAYSELGA